MSAASKEELQRFVLNLPQIVPESWCMECRICCRFPDTEKVQTPFWSPLEAGWAENSWFKEAKGAPSLAPRLVRCGETGYRCPAFEPETNRCSIHAVKPLDCRLYPFVLAKNPGGNEVLLAMDTKCPYIERNQETAETASYAARLMEYLDTPTGSEYLRTNPEIVGPAWPEYTWVSALQRATAWIQESSDSAGPAPDPALRPVGKEDLPALRAALEAGIHSASSFSLPGLLGWADLVRFWWMPLDGCVVLFACQAGGWYLPVPPVGGPLGESRLAAAWQVLEKANRGSEVSRIEGVQFPDLPLFRKAGFRLKFGESEYLYRTSDLAGLRGEGYRSQRGAINRCGKSLSFRIRPFESADLIPCLQLYTRWAVQRQKRSAGDFERRLLRDGLFFHRRLMMDRQELGLSGRVLEAGGELLAYTFGGPVGRDQFCVFLEIARRDPPGLAQTLFREFCREIDRLGYGWLNGMGDCGLPGLRRAKLAYRPAAETALFTATRAK